MPDDPAVLKISDWIAVIFSAAALILSLIAFLRSQVAARAMVFLELRKQFLDIKANLPNWYAKEDMDKWPPYDYDSDDWRPLETYWQHTFNEWFITQKLDSLVLNRLWRLFYTVMR